MADNNPIKYSDLVKPDNSIKELIAQLDELVDAYNHTLKTIKNEAIQLKTSLKDVSGATEEGREIISRAAVDTARLSKSFTTYGLGANDAKVKLEMLRNEERERANNIKLTAKRNAAAEGSYNRLSAQYSINKKILNDLSAEERSNTEYGRQLEAETRAIYEEMKRLQEATGKHQLSVGDYAIAAKGLRAEIKELTGELAAMRLEGKQGTEEYRQLSEKAGKLKDAMTDAQKEVKNMASDTAHLDTVMGAMGAASGGIEAVVGGMELFSGESDNVAEAQKRLQAAMALANGARKIQLGLQKHSTLMLGVEKLQYAALTKAKALDAATTTRGTIATKAATVAQAAFNLVASANPYVLLAVALTTVVGALVLFAAGSDKAAEKQSRLNKVEKIWLDYLAEEEKLLNRVGRERIQTLERSLALAQAQGKSAKEIRKIEDDILNQKIRNNKRARELYAVELRDLDKNRAALGTYQAQLKKALEAQANGKNKVSVKLTPDGRAEKIDVKKAIDVLQASVDLSKEKIDVAVNLKTERLNLDNEKDVLTANRKREDREAAKSAAEENRRQRKEAANMELAETRKASDAKIALIRDGFARERARLEENASREIADIKHRLVTESNLTIGAKRALYSQIKSLRELLALNLSEVDEREAAERLTRQREVEDAQIAAMDDGFAKQEALLRTQYERQLEDLDVVWANEKNLTVERATEIQSLRLAIEKQYANARIKLADETAQKIAQENGKAVSGELEKFDTRQTKEQSEFDLEDHTEAEKTRFKLAAEKERWEKILELNERYGIQKSEDEVAIIKNTIAKIEKELAKPMKTNNQMKGDGVFSQVIGNIGDIMNRDIPEGTNKALSALDTVTSNTLSALSQISQARMEAAQAAVEAANTEVDAAQRALDAEKQARANGYASNVQQAQKELALAKKNQQAALKNQQKAQKQQRSLDAMSQLSNLVTASTVIWKQLGFPWAIPAIAAMFASFAAVQIKSAQLAKKAEGTETYGEGTIELLSGGSHQSGNDIDLGRTPDGKRRRAEGGEYFAIINKRNSRRFRHVIPDVINSLNNGTFAHKYHNAFDENNITMAVHTVTPDLRQLTGDVREIKEQNQRRTSINPDGSIITIYRNLTRRILL